ncbi:hypothetical protein H106_03980 [Trichophyton rubrum CBS 735.88]|nr:hypothetical protein H106_03980 [Trichophyton rubrum CBS 735.88]
MLIFPPNLLPRFPTPYNQPVRTRRIAVQSPTHRRKDRSDTAHEAHCLTGPLPAYRISISPRVLKKTRPAHNSQRQKKKKKKSRQPPAQRKQRLLLNTYSPSLPLRSPTPGTGLRFCIRSVRIASSTMLLPSALSCESRQQQYSSRPRFAASHLFPSTPPPSDDGIRSGNGLLGTCRALQSLLNVSPAPSPSRARTRAPKPERLQSPLQVKPTPYLQDRTTSASSTSSSTGPLSSARTVKRVVKPAAKYPRGANKRRREVYEESMDFQHGSKNREHEDKFSTPKRQRRAPPELPLGLETGDFRSLDTPSKSQRSPTQSPCIRRQWNRRGDNADKISSSTVTSPDRTSSFPSFAVTAATHNSLNNAIGSSIFSSPPHPSTEWTTEDDGRLVELVLEKLKLSKRDWNDCARRMGKNHDSVGRRWKALVGEGNVGLRRGRRMVRGRIDESWRP